MASLSPYGEDWGGGGGGRGCQAIIGPPIIGYPATKTIRPGLIRNQTNTELVGMCAPTSGLRRYESLNIMMLESFGSASRRNLRAPFFCESIALNLGAARFPPRPSQLRCSSKLKALSSKMALVESGINRKAIIREEREDF